MTNNPDCWKALAEAVIRQARDDYEAACEKLRFRPRLKVQAELKQSLEEFFSSDWFSILSAVSGHDEAGLQGRIGQGCNRKEVKK